MSKKIYLFSLVLLALTFTACSETEEAGRYDNWQARSEAFIDSIANVYNSAENKALPDNDPEKLHAYKDPTNNQMLYVKKISKDENSSQKKPLYTSTVRLILTEMWCSRTLMGLNLATTIHHPNFLWTG